MYKWKLVGPDPPVIKEKTMDKAYTYQATLDEIKTNIKDWKDNPNVWDLESEVEKLNTGGVTRKKSKKNKKAKAKKEPVVELKPIDARSKRAIVNKQM